jgi:hypothetical protein
MTGSEGEKQATAFVAEHFEKLGLKPAGDKGTFYQSFPFTGGVSVGEKSALSLQVGKNALEAPVDHVWRPLGFSKNGSVKKGEVVFAGYGIDAPAQGEMEAYDSYTHLDVKDKWVMVFRYLPEDVSDQRRQHLHRFSTLRFKATAARDRGARGLIVVSGPRAKVKNPLVPLSLDAALYGSGIPAISITDDLAQALVDGTGKKLEALQKKLDSGNFVSGFKLKDATVAAHIEIKKEERVGRNVMARLQLGKRPSRQVVIVGAHIDHLGRGRGGSSLAKDTEKGRIHYGADDNASGVAGMLEIAKFLKSKSAQHFSKWKHDVLFVGWSGEELGLLGSSHFVKKMGLKKKKGQKANKRKVVAYVNLDMIGRLRDDFVLLGIGSSEIWPQMLERHNVQAQLPIFPQNDSYVPTDATAFYTAGVPILSAFTGAHEDYHTPRDIAHKLNYEGAESISRFLARITLDLAITPEAPGYVEMVAPKNRGGRRGLRASLGTIPDYAGGEVEGVKLSGVRKGGPAEKAGVKSGDVVVELAGKKIANIYDFTYALEALKPGKETTMVVMREGKRIELKVTPGSRD